MTPTPRILAIRFLTPFYKATVFWVVFVGLLVAGSFLFLPFFPDVFHRLGYGIISTLMACVTVWIFMKFEGGSFGFYGLAWDSQTVPRFALGLATGALILAAMIFIMTASSGLSLVRNQHITNSFPLAMLSILLLSTMEEIGFRSVSFRWLSDAYGLRVAQVITAFAFAAYHLVNGWDVATAFMGPGVWAFVFGLAAARSRGIAVPNGIHTALNIGQTLVGFKTEGWSLWRLNITDATDPSLLERFHATGIILHLAILTGAIAATEYYIRRRPTV